MTFQRNLPTGLLGVSWKTQPMNALLSMTTSSKSPSTTWELYDRVSLQSGQLRPKRQRKRVRRCLQTRSSIPHIKWPSDATSQPRTALMMIRSLRKKMSARLNQRHKLTHFRAALQLDVRLSKRLKSKPSYNPSPRRILELWEGLQLPWLLHFKQSNEGY